jgi:WhiB family redox-sensing transcriptional regulator
MLSQERTADVAWKARAKCRGLDPDLFFPGKGESTKEAKRVCASCPVQPECLAYGLDEFFGIWGGEPERQRRVLRRTAGRKKLRQFVSA